jgi:hypothetical protein
MAKGFEIAEGTARTFWAAADAASTYYIGQPVAWNNVQATHSIGTVLPLLTAQGAYDTTLRQCIAGVVVGFNNRVQTYSSGVEYGVGACATQALQLARNWISEPGMYKKGDPQPLVEVAAIFPHTILRAPICNGTAGVAPSVLTITALGGTDGMVTADTTAANDAASILNMGTIYFRSGLNMGLYRVNKNTTITAPSVTTAFPYDTAVGDTLVAVPFKQGQSVLNYTTGNLFLNCGTAPTAAGTNQFGINIYRLDLSVAGEEYAEFSFMADHFCRARA